MLSSLVRIGFVFRKLSKLLIIDETCYFSNLSLSPLLARLYRIGLTCFFYSEILNLKFESNDKLDASESIWLESEILGVIVEKSCLFYLSFAKVRTSRLLLTRDVKLIWLGTETVKSLLLLIWFFCFWAMCSSSTKLRLSYLLAVWEVGSNFCFN